MTVQPPYIAALGLLVCIFAGSLLLWRRSYRRREQWLEEAVRQRTEELLREQIREKSRKQILQMLVSSESLGTVLDAIARLVREEVPGVTCAILLRKGEGWHTGAAPEFPAEWMKALSLPHAVPFEVWRQPCQATLKHKEPAWRTFENGLNGNAPATVLTQPIGGVDFTLGAILLFDAQVLPDESFPNRKTIEVLGYSTRLAQVAIEHHRLYDDLRFQTRHDSLTGLPNHAQFEDRLSRACLEAKNSDTRLAVLFLDLDRFKHLNDTTSHRVGDLFLSEIAGRIKRALRPGDTVARVGGDEFSILITNVKSPAEPQEIAERILSAVREPMVLDGHAVAASASVGIAIFPDDEKEPGFLQKQADAAMRCAKKSGRDRAQCFSDRNQNLDDARLEQELHIALRDNLFAVFYQPKVGVDGSFCGVEALLRLDHPRLGRVSPVEFIPVAEESGLIVPLGTWVLDEVCRQIAEWRERGIGDVAVAVNVSSIQLARPDFAKQVLSCLGRHGVSPWNIELELTESLLITGGEASSRQMQELRSIGIRFSIDDFGTGFSSLSYLHRLQVDAIKLDRSFVQSIDVDPAARRLVQAMIGVAEGLGLGVVAEGVETEGQRMALAAAGCTMMQGFLFARPQPALDLERYLAANTSASGDLPRLRGHIGPNVPGSSLLQAV